MFRQLAATLTGVVPPAVPTPIQWTNALNFALTGYRPDQYVDFLERYWRAQRIPPALPGVAPGGGRLWGPGVNNVIHRQLARFVQPGNPANAAPPVPDEVTWHHLVYALLIENTRIFEIFERVLSEWIQGERLPVPSQATQRWIRASEELFFSGPRPGSLLSLTSAIRPDTDATRRNAYYRLLGMDVVHPGKPGRGANFVKPETANREFSQVFTRLLREVWRGYVNRNNGIGENRTDDQAIHELVRLLRELLTARRQNGMLSREEYAAVATASWFHGTIEYDTSIVQNLTAQSTSVAGRLRRIGDLVGVPMHSRADSFFQLAEPLSVLLIDIESGAIDNALPFANQLYGVGGAWTPLMEVIITHWSIVTGENIKESFDPRPVQVQVAAPIVTRVGTNGGSRIPAGTW